MAYQMEYAFRELKKSSIKKDKKRNVFLAVMLLVGVVMGARFGGAALEVMIMGKQGSVYSAASEMVTHLREGMDFDEAVYVFYEEISGEQGADKN